MSDDQAGLEVGRRWILHPGPLRWLRASVWMVVLFVVVSALYAGIQMMGNPLTQSSDPLDVLKVAALCLVSLGLYAVIVRLTERRWPEELALRPAAIELAIGLAVGVVMLSAVVAGLWALGVYEISGPRPASAWGAVSMALQSGILEELMFRAVAMRLLMRAFGIWPALVLQAALFGVLHLANPNATPMAAAAIAVEAGLMLAGFYLLTGRLWMSIGVHAAWNFTQGWIWGASVSGIPVVESWLVSNPKPGAPEILSGGAFGPEASLPAMVVGTLVAVVTLWWAWKKGNFKARGD
jgi:membrane protease YdiL (CAAX protease family)